MHHQFRKRILFLAFGNAHGLVAHARGEQSKAVVLVVGTNDVNRDMHRFVDWNDFSLSERIDGPKYFGHAGHDIIVNAIGTCWLMELFWLPHRPVDALNRQATTSFD